MNDNMLIKRCQNGDKAAFEQLLNDHYDTIYRFAYRWCGDQHNAQDITQQACLKLARGITKFEHRSSFTSWLYRLVINCAKDYYKSPAQHNIREESSEPLEQAFNTQLKQAPYESSYEQQRVNDDRMPERLYAQQILEHINTLQEDLRDTLILVYGKGMSHAEVARQLKLKESTVSWRIHQARKQLKQTFSSSRFDTQDAAIRGTL